MQKKEHLIEKISLMNFFLHLFFLSPVAIFFFQQRGLNYFQILAMESVLGLFIFIFEIPTGIFADKFGRKKSIIIGTMFLALEPLIFIFANSITWFTIAFAISGIGIAFHSGSIEALIYDHLKSNNKEGNMKKAMGTFGSASLIAMVIAPSIGSYLAKDLIMPQFIFLILMSMGAMFIGFIISLLIKNTKQNNVKEENSFLLFKKGINSIKKDNHLLKIILLSIFSSPFIFTLNYLYQPYFKNSGVNTEIFGIIFAVALLFAALFQKYSYVFEKKLGGKWTIFLVTILPGIFYIFMGLTSHPIWAILLFITIRTMSGLRDPLFSHYINFNLSSKNRATMLSLISMFGGLYLLIIRLIIGKLADISLSYSFFFMGIIIILASLFLKIDRQQF